MNESMNEWVDFFFRVVCMQYESTLAGGGWWIIIFIGADSGGVRGRFWCGGGGFYGAELLWVWLAPVRAPCVGVPASSRDINGAYTFSMESTHILQHYFIHFLTLPTSQFFCFFFLFYFYFFLTFYQINIFSFLSN